MLFFKLNGNSVIPLRFNFVLVIFIFLSNVSYSQTPFRIVGYYCGTTIPPDSFETEKLTHLIFSFGGLKGNKFVIHSSVDSVIIKQMVALKKDNSKLKVMLSLGGWGGCEKCSEVFSSSQDRKEFAESVKKYTSYFKTDGIDLDWEYPVVKGFPGHIHQTADKTNFTELLKELRLANGDSFQISFAAGGFTSYIDSSIDWTAAMKYADFVNLMSYDLVHGYSKISGHHTPLYSTPEQVESTDHAVKMLLKKGVPAEKIVIGAAFYGRFFRIDDGAETGLYQPCTFSHAFSSKYSTDSLAGFEMFWDDVATAPYAIHKTRKLLATYDDDRSVKLKTAYALNMKLGGIMFWQLYDDKLRDGLLDVVYEGVKE